MMKKVCVTGGSGFLANHIIRHLLRHPKNFQVVTTVRDKARISTSGLAEFSATYGSRLEIVEANLNTVGSFDEPIAGCDYVIHLASPVAFTEDPVVELIHPAVDGTLNVLNSCKRSGTVKRVVLTSSIAAIATPRPESHGKLHDESIWNTTKPEECAYSYAKTQAEKAAWDFQKQSQAFDLVSINPGTSLGPVFSKDKAPLGSQGVVHAILAHSSAGVVDMSATFVDADDVAIAHLWAMESESAKGRYIVAQSEPVSMQHIAEVLLQKYPHLKIKTKKISSELLVWGAWTYSFFNRSVSMFPLENLWCTPRFNNTKYLTESGNQLKPLEQAIIETAESMIKLGALEPRPSSWKKWVFGVVALMFVLAVGFWLFIQANIASIFVM